jgi:hypothetical protein
MTWGYYGAGGWNPPVIPFPIPGLTTFTASFAGAQARPILDKLGDIIDGADLGLVGDDSTDNAVAFARLANVPEGSKVQLRPGRYRYTGSIAMNAVNVSLVGSGRNRTILVPLTTSLPAITIGAGFVSVRDVGFDRITKPIAGGDGIVCAQGLTNLLLENLWINKQYRGVVLAYTDISYANRLSIQNCESHGVDCLYGTGGTMQWYVTDVLSQANLGDGFHCVNTTATSGIGPFMRDCHSFHNGGTGYYFQGDVSHPLNDVWLLRCVSSAEEACGIHFNDVYGHLHMMHDCWVELVGRVGGIGRGYDGTLSVAPNTGHGIRVTGTLNNGAINIGNGLVWQCSWSGIDVETSNVHVVGMTCVDNGQAEHASLENRAGMLLKAAVTHVSGCTFIKAPALAGQARGITVSGVVTFVGVDDSNLFAGYTVAQSVDTSLATLTGTVSAIGPLGLHLNTGRLPLVIHDETGGATPSKPIRVASGRLEILNNAVSQILLAVDESAAADDTRLLLWDVTAGTLKRVSRGAADSESSGFRNLRIPN